MYRLWIIIQILIIFVIAFAFGYFVCGILSIEPYDGSEMPYKPADSNLVMVQSNSLEAYAPHWYPKTRTYGSLIDCLIRYESGGNPNAVGDKGLANGILQFHKATFDLYSEKYNISLDYKNPDDQILLCDMMLKDNLGYHWTTYKFCKGR